MTTLWHYTCGHGYADLGSVGTLYPLATLRPDGLRRMPPWSHELAYLIWATPMGYPNVIQLGLTRDAIGCDRTAHRYRILNPRQFMPWPEARPFIHPRLVDELQHPGSDPDSWWVTGHPAEVEYAPLTAGASFRPG